ncbi:sensor histidine kinase [Agromyces laixinhei]|uniref:sensor histidine kinase n=1 Tax=Agromyces laixinhei TaxID=2585717 RepID=UPI00143E0718|nr:histidine kinase [Agromyces laixinhei]
MDAASDPSAPESLLARAPDRVAPTLADWAWAAAGAAALLPLTIVELVRAVLTSQTIPWAVVVGALYFALHLTVAVRRRSPRGALIAASAVMLALTAASLPDAPTVVVLLPSSLVYLVFVFTAAASDDRWADGLALVVGIVGAGLMTVVAIAHGSSTAAPVQPEPAALIALAGFLVASIGAAWALGRYRRESRRKRAAQELGRAQAAELSVQHEREAIADERRRIGRELHDVISHSLAVMVAQAEASRVLQSRADGAADPRARIAIEQVVATGRAAMNDMRGLLTVLAEPDPEPEPGDGIVGAALRAPSPGLADLADLALRASGPERIVDVDSTGEPRVISPGTGLTAYRVAQESLTNTLKHTRAPTRSRVQLDWTDDALVLTVSDDGTAVTDGRRPGAGRGIRGMRDRVEQAGGRLESGPRGDIDGWMTRATLPFDSHPTDREPRDD